MTLVEGACRRNGDTADAIGKREERGHGIEADVTVCLKLADHQGDHGRKHRCGAFEIKAFTLSLWNKINEHLNSGGCMKF